MANPTTLGTGIDITYIPRIRKLIERYNHRFLIRFFNPPEFNLTDFNTPLTLNTNLINKIARRYAGKEAIAKSLGTGIGQLVQFKAITITNDDNGAPRVSLSPTVQSKIQQRFQLTDFTIMLSLSDDKDYAVAIAIFQKIT